MNRWKASYLGNDYLLADRFYITELLHVPREGRPPYSPGDPFDVSGDRWEVPGTIIAASAELLEIEMTGGKVLKLKPTPPGEHPPVVSFRGSPSEDWSVA